MMAQTPRRSRADEPLPGDEIHLLDRIPGDIDRWTQVRRLVSYSPALELWEVIDDRSQTVIVEPGPQQGVWNEVEMPE